MTSFTKTLAAAAAIGSLAAPAAGQYYPQQPTYPQTYPQQYPPYQQQYPQQAYPYGYGTGNVVTDIIDSLLGNRYSVTDRQAVRRCANAAVNQAQSQYGGGYGTYGNRYGQQYGQGYNQYSSLHVTAITDVQRRQNGLRVSGLLSSGAGYGGQYDNQDSDQYGYQGQDYARGYAAGDLSFRCNVDYRGAVTGIRIRPANAYRG